MTVRLYPMASGRIIKIVGQFRYTLALRLRHPIIDPAEITRELALDPEHNWKAGQPRFTPRGDPLPGVYRNSYWISPIIVNQDSTLSHSIADALKLLKPHKSFLEAFRRSGGSIGYFIGWFSERNSGALLDWALLKSLSELQIDLELDFYGGPDRNVIDAEQPQ